MREATVGSVEKARTGTPLDAATPPAALTAGAKSGPTMSCAPSAIACEAAAAAPSAVPWLSLTTSWMPLVPGSRMARAAALRRPVPTWPAAPGAESGTSIATRVGPSPITSPCAGPSGRVSTGSGSATWGGAVPGPSAEVHAPRVSASAPKNASCEA